MPYEQIIKDTSATEPVAYLKNNIVGVETTPEWGTDEEAYIYTSEEALNEAIEMLETETNRTDFVGQNPKPR